MRGPFTADVVIRSQDQVCDVRPPGRDGAMKHLGRLVVGGLIALGTVVPVLVASTTEAGAAAPVKLNLINGWADYGTGTPEVSLLSGVVTFQGAIAAPPSNTNTEPFKLPAA